MQIMLNNVRVVIALFLITQQICHCYTKNIPHSTKEPNRTPIANGKHNNPTTSYYRHKLFGPNTYAFGFEVNDQATGNKQFRDERRFANGSVQGSYGYVRPDGNVMITHFIADSERGFLSQTQNFEPGNEDKWQENWPTKKPSIFINNPQASIQPAVFYDDKEKLNLTSILLPVEAIQEEHGIDLNPTKLEKELINPAVLEVINGETPLVNGHGKTDNSLGFETIHKFIPSDFPIIPFELPQDPININHQNETEIKVNRTVSSEIYNKQKINNSEKVLKPTLTTEIYTKSKENNSEKSIPTETLKISSLHNNDGIKEEEEDGKNLPKAKSLTIDDEDYNGWYDKVFKETRQKYFEKI